MFLDNEVIKDCSPYVPMRTGFLMQSGILGTKIGSGKVVYNAPYAHYVYYGTHMNFSKAKHPHATAQWFEVVKPVKKKAWLSAVNKIIKE